MMHYRLTDIGNKTAAELAQVLATIPAAVTITLSQRDIVNRTTEELIGLG
ncbi:TPA: hypothetical protein ACTXXA_000460 [Legionella anisa]